MEEKKQEERKAKLEKRPQTANPKSGKKPDPGVDRPKSAVKKKSPKKPEDLPKKQFEKPDMVDKELLGMNEAIDQAFKEEGIE